MHFPLLAELIVKKSGFSGNLGMILGSGLSSISNVLTNKIEISYQDLHGFPVSTVAGHDGKMVAGNLDDIPVIIASGRFHYYEGYSYQEVVSIVKVFYELGIQKIIITNSSGALNRSFKPGELIVINGHLDCTYRNGYKDPKLWKGSPHYNDGLINKARESAKECSIKLNEGVYCWTQGPSYETPAEVQDLIRLGGDAVGMSTVPEVIESSELRMDVLVLSCMTNMAAGLIDKPLDHNEVVRVANKSSKNMIKLIYKLIKRI
ncbi:MAG: purine-nucleoside phosphorylase [bacterium TMED144]|nr:MAG: purine-nucleoside phosphorylase [bacterium TMED144]|tara:strand:- start:1736 stop:2521 length:786 start_codon:yes stop_codon:yes gene_type:complete